MGVRSRFARFATIAGLYAVAAGAAGYFVFEARHGARGLESRKLLRADLSRLDGELAALRRERAVWERRVTQLQSDPIDRDLLDERVRHLINRAHPDDVVIFRDAAADVAD
jgi:cell division protein FtsB